MMMAPEPRRGTESRQRTEVVGVRMTPEERERWERTAAAHGVSLPELLRSSAEAVQRVLGHYGDGLAGNGEPRLVNVRQVLDMLAPAGAWAHTTGSTWLCTRCGHAHLPPDHLAHFPDALPAPACNAIIRAEPGGWFVRCDCTAAPR